MRPSVLLCAILLQLIFEPRVTNAVRLCVCASACVCAIDRLDLWPCVTAKLVLRFIETRVESRQHTLRRTHAHSINQGQLSHHVFAAMCLQRGQHRTRSSVNIFVFASRTNIIVSTLQPHAQSQTVSLITAIQAWKYYLKRPEKNAHTHTHDESFAVYLFLIRHAPNHPSRSQRLGVRILNIRSDTVYLSHSLPLRTSCASGILIIRRRWRQTWRKQKKKNSTVSCHQHPARAHLATHLNIIGTPFAMTRIVEDGATGRHAHAAREMNW